MPPGANSPAPTMDALGGGFPPANRDAWMALVAKAIKGAEFEKKMVSRTADGLRVEPIYTRADTIAHAAAGVPGLKPFTRGAQTSPNGLGWDIRQFHTGTDPEAVNKAVLEDLAGGANSIALHFATLGGSGLVFSESALKKALDGVLLDVCPIALIAGERTPAVADALMAHWTREGIAPADRQGHFNADPIGLLAVMGQLSVPLPKAMSDALNLIGETSKTPRVTALIADGNGYHCAGATEAMELAAMLATFIAYLRAAETAGIAPEIAIPKIAVSLAVDADEFLGIAKLRAARLLLWRIAEASGAGEAARDIHITAVTSWRMLAKRDPWTNIIRNTIACAAGALGGADAITVLPFTYALGETDAFARRVARNIQIVCQEESSLGRVVDPAGGSWYVEKLTQDLAEAAWTELKSIEQAGGMVAALKSGLVQDRIAKAAAVRAKAIATGRQELTGVSAFPLLGDDGLTVTPWRGGASPAQNPAETVKPLKLSRLSEPFEALRDAADAHAQSGKPLEVFLASLGQVVDHNVRSTWIKNYLAAGGIAANMTDGYAGAEPAAAAFRASGLDAACICSSDAVNAEHAEATARALKAAGARLVLMAGRPGDREDALRAAGVDQFLFAGADAIETLGSLQQRLGRA
ncbi:MAG: methylmalonyl-CoA mutase family protein [Hyphomicrobium sp.]|nr:methylmalonyl-CoA mutase family protein [Hyphomicrobium sp.]